MAGLLVRSASEQVLTANWPALDGVEITAASESKGMETTNLRRGRVLGRLRAEGVLLL